MCPEEMSTNYAIAKFEKMRKDMLVNCQVAFAMEKGGVLDMPMVGTLTGRRCFVFFLVLDGHVVWFLG